MEGVACHNHNSVARSTGGECVLDDVTSVRGEKMQDRAIVLREKTERKSLQQRTGVFQGNNYAASWQEQSKGYSLMMLNSFCSCLLISRQKSGNEVFSFHFTPSLSIMRWENEKGTTRNCQQKKFDLLFKIGAEEIIQMPTFLILPKDCFFFFTQALICSVRDIIVKDFSFWVVKPSFSRLWIVQARSHPWQISCFQSSSHQLIPHCQLNWQFSPRGRNLSCSGWPSLPASFLSLFATQRTGIVIDASLLLPGIHLLQFNAAEWILIIVLYCIMQ